MGIRLREDYVAIEVEQKEEMTEGGLFLRYADQTPVVTGIIREVGPGKMLDSSTGARKPLDLEVGQRVTFEFGRGEKWDINGKVLNVMQAHFVRMVHTDENTTVKIAYEKI